MKKQSIYSTVLVLFFGAIALIIYKYRQDAAKNEQMVYSLLPRKGAAAQSPEFILASQKSVEYLNVLKTNPQDEKANLALAALYIQEARATGNYMYYDRAAMKSVNNVLTKDPKNFNALSIKALLFMSQHHFAEGLKIAEEARAINPYNAFIYGIIVDGNVEMGNYEKAVENSDKMVSIRPDIRSYSRISYLREIYGDYPGAIDAMKMAVSAGLPGDESTEWTRVQLAKLYEATGDMRTAEMHYMIALQNRPAYPFALAGLARVAASKKDFKTAIGFYQQADSLVSDFSMKEELVDTYLAAGDAARSQAAAQSVVDGMNTAAQNETRNDSSGHYSDKELAYAYLKVKDYDKALDHAMLEYNRRPDNIDVNEAVAWVYYSKGDYDKAVSYIKTAMKTNSKNPSLLCRAGLIYSKAGDRAMAKTLLQTGINSNANLTGSLKTASVSALQSL